MTKPEAHDLLNAVQQGMPATRQQITRALYATGDLGCMRQPAVEPAAVEASHAWPYYANTPARAALGVEA